jgi:hypothetical protein
LKAELFSSDFVIGFAIFLIGIGIFGIFYTSIQSDITDYRNRNEIQNKATNIANLLVTSSGEPIGWSSTNVRIIGLRDSGIINLTKFEELKKINYYTVKNLLGVDGYELYIELKNQTGSVLKNGTVTYSFGLEKSESALQAFYVERYGLASLNGNVTKIMIGVVVWL